MSTERLDPSLRAACRVRNATLCARLAALIADGRVTRSAGGYCLAAT